jgi:hypothetical protein
MNPCTTLLQDMKTGFTHWYWQRKHMLIMWNGLSWLRTGSNGNPWWWTYTTHKRKEYFDQLSVASEIAFGGGGGGKFSMSLINYASRHEDAWRNAGVAPPLLTSALDVGVQSAPHPGHFTHGKRAPSTHWIGGWLGPESGLDAVQKRIISCPCQELNPGHPACCYTDWGIPGPPKK